MRFKLLLLAFVIASIAHQSVQAHFPWLAVDQDGNALYFFGETPADRTYKLPPSIMEAKVFHLGEEPKPVELKSIDSDAYVGMKSSTSVSKQATLASKVTYGLYHGTRLDYYTQHVGGKLPADRKNCKPPPKQHHLRAQVIDTDSGVDIFVIWKNEPLVDAQVRLYCEKGHEEGSAKTDKNGKVSFTDKEVEDGLNGIVVGYTADESGKLDDQAYKSVSRYLTLTFRDPEDFKEPTTSSVSVRGEAFPSIPKMVTSFGAAIANDSLYVYGGHMGRAHEYYAEAQARTLWQLNLKDPKQWNSLGDGPGLQGLAMVAHKGKLYRIGGFTAKNKDGEEKDLWSQSSVASYDIAKKTWVDLPSLPEPRSSFDAVVAGDQIYVIGGWSMQGESTQWHEDAVVLDLAKQPIQWKVLPKPPFQRRALSVAAIDGKVYAIGGMQRKGGPSTRVDVFDTKKQAWERGPDLIGSSMDGFGSSSFAVGGRLYVTTYGGALQRLSIDGKSWEKIHELERARFFHRMLPMSDKELLVVGGASMSSGKFEELDVIQLAE